MPPGKHVMLSMKCPEKTCGGRLRLQADAPGRLEEACPICARQVSADISSELHSSRQVTRCIQCGGKEFFIRKDFPQRLGLLLVVIFGIVATVFYAMDNVVATFTTLGALVVVDGVVYLFVGKVTVCYRCRAEYRNVVYNPAHTGFDLATSEKYN